MKKIFYFPVNYIINEDITSNHFLNFSTVAHININTTVHFQVDSNQESFFLTLDS